jgi:hypothetical protein
MGSDLYTFFCILPAPARAQSASAELHSITVNKITAGCFDLRHGGVHVFHIGRLPQENHAPDKESHPIHSTQEISGFALKWAKYFLMHLCEINNADPFDVYDVSYSPLTKSSGQFG